MHRIFVAVSLVIFGCNTDRPLVNVPVDAALAPGFDLARASDLDASISIVGNNDLSFPDFAFAPHPCTLMPAGDPVQTVSYDNPASNWHCEGLLARSTVPNHVIHYGDVSLRFGGWDDPAIVGTELDVTDWPPTVVRPATQFFFSMHTPAQLFELSPDTFGMTWSFDNDGLGPQGVEFETINTSTWSAGANVLLNNNMGVQGPPVGLDGGKQFAITLHTPYGSTDNNMNLAIVGADGSIVQQAVLAHASSSASLAVQRTESALLAASAFSTCGASDPSFCAPNSIVILNATGGTSAQSPLVLSKVATVAARNPTLSIVQPMIVSNRKGANFLLWWELGNNTSYLFGVPVSANGQPLGPVEVWFTLQAYASAGTPSIGPSGVVVPIIYFPPVDSGIGPREIHLVQRQLTAEAPVRDISFSTMYTSFYVSTAQMDAPRSLIVGYSDYPTVSGSAGFGLLSKYICQED